MHLSAPIPVKYARTGAPKTVTVWEVYATVYLVITALIAVKLLVQQTPTTTAPPPPACQSVHPVTTKTSTADPANHAILVANNVTDNRLSALVASVLHQIHNISIQVLAIVHVLVGHTQVATIV